MTYYSAISTPILDVLVSFDICGSLQTVFNHIQADDDKQPVMMISTALMSRQTKLLPYHKSISTKTELKNNLSDQCGQIMFALKRS